MSPPNLPPDTGLPVEAVVPQVRAALADGADASGGATRSVGSPGCAVLVAPPGAGKTTVVPLRLLGQPWVSRGRIVVLEPRRLAARAAARRMADLLGESVGETVGYRTRDERHVGPHTRIEVITEGILVRRLQADPSLDGTAAVLLDEVHERNLVTDLSLALLLDARAGLRPDLRVLAMSATVDAGRLATVLGGADGPAVVVHSDGRQHPVTLRYHPPGPRDRPDAHAARVIAAIVGPASPTSPPAAGGDVLVFLPGAAEIGRVADRLRAPGVLPPHVDVRRLFGALPVAEQDVALAPSPPGRRRVVLATDIAESSLTVAGVDTVVDAGLARVPRFDPTSGLTRLVTETASQAAGDQRAGRAGRLGPGVAHRLYAEADRARRPLFPTPEIAAVDLAGFALELAVWGAAPQDLALLDQPPAAAWAEAVALLRRLHAIDDAQRPTAVGRKMADLPVHPRLARMLLDGVDRHVGWTAAMLAALLEERDVLRGRPAERPVDLAVRARLVDAAGGGRGGRGSAGSASGVGGAAADDLVAEAVEVDRNALRTASRRAGELARRVGVKPGRLDEHAIGRLVATAYPDRLAQRRGTGYRLRDGGGGRLAGVDPLAASPWLAVAHLDHGRDGVEVRLAAHLDEADLLAVAADDVAEVDEVRWDDERDDLRARHERRLGALVLSATDGPPPRGPATVGALLARVLATEGRALPWTDAARQLQARLQFLHHQDPDRWPAVDDATLLATLPTWLGPLLVGATGRRDLARVDLPTALRIGLDHRARTDLDRLAPTAFAAAAGRRVPIRYEEGRPTAASRVQDLFGTTVHPTVADGKVPVVLELLSPAGRPIQVTADLPGFWAGSWSAVRKDLAGRYPKHAWPPAPTLADAPAPRTGGGRPPGRNRR